MTGYNEIGFIKMVSKYEHEIIASASTSSCSYNFRNK